jgi:hypothetical protein
MASADALDEAYKPSDDEPFMSERQRDYFRRKLLHWKEEIPFHAHCDWNSSWINWSAWNYSLARTFRS